MHRACLQSIHCRQWGIFVNLIVSSAPGLKNLAPDARLGLGRAPWAAALAPITQSRGTLCSSRGRRRRGVRCAARGSRCLARIVAQRRSGLLRQRRIGRCLRGRGPRANGSHSLARRWPSILWRSITWRRVAGPICLLEWSLPTRRVGLGACIAARPLTRLSSDRRRVGGLRACFLVGGLVASILISQGRGSAHVGRPTVMDRQSLTWGPIFVNVPSRIAEGSFSVQRTLLTSNQFMVGNLGRATWTEGSIRPGGGIGIDGTGIHVLRTRRKGGSYFKATVSPLRSYFKCCAKVDGCLCLSGEIWDQCHLSGFYGAKGLEKKHRDWDINMSSRTWGDDGRISNSIKHAPRSFPVS